MVFADESGGAWNLGAFAISHRAKSKS